MNKPLITNVSLNNNLSKFSDLYPMILTLIGLIILSGIIKIIHSEVDVKFLNI